MDELMKLGKHDKKEHLRVEPVRFNDEGGHIGVDVVRHEGEGLHFHEHKGHKR